MAAIGLGAAFIVTSMTRNFFKWTIDSCDTTGQLSVDNSTKLVAFDLDMTADIGWREFTVTYLDAGAVAEGCFTEVVEGESYMIGDHQVEWVMMILESRNNLSRTRGQPICSALAPNKS